CYEASMRTTLTIDECLVRDLKEIAHRSGKPFKQVVNETLHAGLSARKGPRRTRRYHLKPASLGQPLPGIVLDKALQLADSLDDVEIARKLELRK
ncbi:MAG TPA: DUF2191 domain-containing protein, partial [Thermoanaerobaculia bacterium]|nr:DUF2191 domain-containing protein [Thermoanaerobaculia bacterium]